MQWESKQGENSVLIATAFTLLICLITEQMKIRVKKMKKLAPILRNDGDNLSSITTVSLKQLKLLLMSSNNSSLELDGRVSQQFLPRDYKKRTFALWLPSHKRESFLLVLPPASHRKESKKKQNWVSLDRFPRLHNSKWASWRQTGLPKRECWQIDNGVELAATGEPPGLGPISF